MKCLKCNYENNDDAKFCVNCGNKLYNEDEEDDGSLDFLDDDEEDEESTEDKVEEPIVVETGKKVESDTTTENIKYDETSAIIAIVLSLFCCGNIIGIVFAALSLSEGDKVKGYLRRNDIEGAKATLEKANNYSKYAYIALAVIAALVVVLVIGGVALAGFLAVCEY